MSAPTADRQLRPNPAGVPAEEFTAPGSAAPVTRARLSHPGNGAVVVQLDGELDAATAPRLAELLQCRLTSALTTVVVDLSGLKFLGVAGVSVLARAALRAEAEHVAFRVVTGPHCVDWALRAAQGLQPRLACYRSLAAAVEA